MRRKKSEEENEQEEGQVHVGECVELEQMQSSMCETGSDAHQQLGVGGLCDDNTHKPHSLGDGSFALPGPPPARPCGFPTMDLGCTLPPFLLLSAGKNSTGHPVGTISGIVIGVLVGLLLLATLLCFLLLRKTGRYKGFLHPNSVLSAPKLTPVQEEGHPVLGS